MGHEISIDLGSDDGEVMCAASGDRRGNDWPC